MHVVDIVADGPKPNLVRRLGATYHCGPIPADVHPDIVLECTGVADVVADVVRGTARNAVVCLTGLSTGGRQLPTDVGGINRELVLENDIVFGSVSAARRHYEQAVTALETADPGWLTAIITRRVPLDRWPDAFRSDVHDIKVVIELSTPG